MNEYDEDEEVYGEVVQYPPPLNFEDPEPVPWYWELLEDIQD